MKLKSKRGTTCSMTMARLSRIVCAARLLSLLLLPAVVQAQFNYTTDNGTITITEYTGPGGAVTIPSTINGLPVTTIGEGAFYYRTSLSSVTIPNSVTSIGANSCGDGLCLGTFSWCTSLTNITIGNSVTNIGVKTFYSCTNLMGVYFQGNATSSLPVFYGVNNATVYYLPGTTGWAATFSGRPTAQWLPEARASDADFGVRTNQFRFNICWASDKVVVVEASPNLSNPVWTPVSTNTLTGGSSYFSDPQWANHPSRFYRLVSPVP